MPTATPAWMNLTDRIVTDLGGGMIDIELPQKSLDNAVIETLKEFRATASPATTDGYQFLSIVENQRFYSIPSSVVDITDISRVGAGVVSGIEGLQYGEFIYQAMQTGKMFDLASYHMTQSFIETLNTITAADPSFIYHSALDGSQLGYEALDGQASSDEFNNVPDTSADMELDNRSRFQGPVLELLNLPKNSFDTYLLNVRIGRSDAELINDIDTGPWIHQYARACAKIMLGNAYRKFDGMPGPGGGITLPGNDLIGEGREDKEILKQDLLDLKYGEEAYGFMMG